MFCGESIIHFSLLFTISTFNDSTLFVIHLLSYCANAQLDLDNTANESKFNICPSPPFQLI